MSEPREFWIDDIDDNGIARVYCSDGWGIHAIEYSAYARLLAIVQIYKEALKYYADHYNWVSDADGEFTEIRNVDWEKSKQSKSVTGGKRAREAIAKAEGLMK